MHPHPFLVLGLTCFASKKMHFCPQHVSRDMWSTTANLSFASSVAVTFSHAGGIVSSISSSDGILLYAPLFNDGSSYCVGSGTFHQSCLLSPISFGTSSSGAGSYVFFLYPLACLHIGHHHLVDAVSAVLSVVILWRSGCGPMRAREPIVRVLRDE